MSTVTLLMQFSLIFINSLYYCIMFCSILSASLSFIILSTARLFYFHLCVVLKFQKLHPLNTLPEVRRLSAISKVHDSADVAQSIVFSEVCEQSLSDNVAVEVSTPVDVSVVTGQFDSADAVGAHSGQSDVFVEASGVAVELSGSADTVTEVCEPADVFGKSSGQSDAVDEVCEQSLSDNDD